MIDRAENAWLERSLHFISEQFDNVFLPSHDLEHHLRTWEKAKFILREAETATGPVNYEVVEAILLATMFHDTGMVVTRNPEHGAFSREFYLDFLEQVEAEPSLNAAVVSTIELHDKKERYTFSMFSKGIQPDILTVTGMADDLDALGIIGIYRYVEIYLHRGMGLASLGDNILKNLSKRYGHSIRAASLLPAFIEKVEKEYMEIVSFFEKYNRQVAELTEPEKSTEGPVGVVNFIRKQSVEGTTRPELFHKVAAKFSKDKFVLNYFNDLKNALNIR